jgi:uncharacterized protein (TIGR00661 family)
MNILYFISDHGFGHATRSIGLLRKLQTKLKNYNVVIYNEKSYDFLQESMPDTRIIKFPSDVGPITKTKVNEIDPDNSFHLFSKWIDNEEHWIKKVKNTFKFSPDLIITDISPMGLRLSEKIRCPAVTIANFSWTDILKKFPFNPEKNKVNNWLKDSFSISQMTLKVPLSMNLEGFKNIRKTTFLCREPNNTKKNILQELNIKNKLITSYLGQNLSIKFSKIQKDQTLWHLNILTNKKIVKKGIEGQDVIFSSDLVVAKIGHSIISECVKYRIPMIVIPRGDYFEDKVLGEYVDKLQIGKIFSHNTKVIGIPNNEEIEIMKGNIDEKQIKNLENLTSAENLILEFKK